MSYYNGYPPSTVNDTLPHTYQAWTQSLSATAPIQEYFFSFFLKLDYDYLVIYCTITVPPALKVRQDTLVLHLVKKNILQGSFLYPYVLGHNVKYISYISYKPQKFDKLISIMQCGRSNHSTIRN